MLFYLNNLFSVSYPILDPGSLIVLDEHYHFEQALPSGPQASWALLSSGPKLGTD